MSILATFMISLSFTACAVHTPEGSIIVDPDRSYYPHAQSDFCPPRQAKKVAAKLKSLLFRRLFLLHIFLHKFGMKCQAVICFGIDNVYNCI
ncbi:MAG: hypothetical protein A3F63_08300 [Pseudomonadales bacterium RIFCSPHIGHO2_12_FULL_40_16]|nr:MAG: hypothetical protein A3F63_08300 [Pseudomonadales bacterium RIFCSPHIGHO2_12_FULL_40_16]